MQLRGLATLLLLRAVAGFQGPLFHRCSDKLQSPVRDSSTSLAMSTIAVIGASGLTASECVYQALLDGDKVIGLTR